MKLVECVPNFSEDVPRSSPPFATRRRHQRRGRSRLQRSGHNRSVITFVAPLDVAVDAALAGMRTAAAHIDLTVQRGEHPRIGATAVVPFIPLEGATMDDCIALARSLGARAATELQIPVYLYERAASSPARENLADVRRGEFEGLRDDIATNPARHPDFGEPRLHPTAGATAVGARPFLVAYNVYLGGAENLQVAKNVAKALRHSSGGLRYVKGLGLEVDGQAQVSMNLVDIDKTPLFRAFDMVRMEALAQGVTPTWSEIVGLVPERALFDTAARHLQLRRFSQDRCSSTAYGRPWLVACPSAASVASVAAPTPAPEEVRSPPTPAPLGAALRRWSPG
jgi:glutamate formiminotransferase/formiminotetrahydrofolate cyclodeaminase